MASVGREDRRIPLKDGSSPSHPPTTRLPELVYLVAQRLGTGARLEAVIAPRDPLNPSTAVHAGLGLDLLETGMPVARFKDRWGAFLREADVLCEWGDFASGLLEQEGASLPAERIDLRRVMGDRLRGRPGTLEQTLERLGLSPTDPWGKGRAGQRLALLTTLTGHLHSWSPMGE